MLNVNEEEWMLILKVLKTRLDALQTEMTVTGDPQFNIELGREEKVVRGLVQRLEARAAGRPAKRPVRASARRREGKRRG